MGIFSAASSAANSAATRLFSAANSFCLRIIRLRLFLVFHHLLLVLFGFRLFPARQSSSSVLLLAGLACQRNVHADHVIDGTPFTGVVDAGGGVRARARAPPRRCPPDASHPVPLECVRVVGHVVFAHRTPDVTAIAGGASFQPRRAACFCPRVFVQQGKTQLLRLVAIQTRVEAKFHIQPSRGGD